MNFIAILLYLIFLMIYIAFNGYIIKRAGDFDIVKAKTKLAIYIYTGIVTAILAITFIYLAAIQLF